MAIESFIGAMAPLVFIVLFGIMFSYMMYMGVRDAWKERGNAYGKALAVVLLAIVLLIIAAVI
jgi:hypothetical protein